MDLAGFRFTVDELDGCRLIEASYPAVIDVSKLSTIIVRYYELWDEDVPTVSLQNLSRLEGFTDDVKQILKSVIQRTVLEPSFVAAAWYTGENRKVFDEISQLRREAGRSTNDVFETREEAIGFLRDRIRAWRDGVTATEPGERG